MIWEHVNKMTRAGRQRAAPVHRRRHWGRSSGHGPAVRMLLAGVCMLLVLGCGTTLRETYYVAVVDLKKIPKGDPEYKPGASNWKPGALQFYRFDLKADAVLSDVQFVSGWFDARALEALAAEYVGKKATPTTRPAKNEDGEKVAPTTQPAKNEDGKKVAPTTQPTNNEDTPYLPKRYFIAGPQGRFLPAEDVRLAIIMNSDPKPLLEAIKGITESAELKALADGMLKKAQERREKDEKFSDQIWSKIREEFLKNFPLGTTQPGTM